MAVVGSPRDRFGERFGDLEYIGVRRDDFRDMEQLNTDAGKPGLVRTVDELERTDAVGKRRTPLGAFGGVGRSDALCNAVHQFVRVGICGFGTERRSQFV